MFKPWSVVDDEELKLLRAIKNRVVEQGGVDPEMHSLLGQLRRLKTKKS